MVDDCRCAAAFVRRAAACQLVIMLLVSPRNWLQDQLLPLPRVGVPLPQVLLWSGQASAKPIAAGVLAMLVHTAVLPASPSTWRIGAIFAGFLMLAVPNTSRLQPEMLHGMGLLVACCVDDSMVTAQAVLAGAWLWSGVHKMNPWFLNLPSSLIDPVFEVVLGESMAKQVSRELRGLVAVCEASAGGVLLVATFWPRHAPRSHTLGRLWRALTTASALALAAMHACIVVVLVMQANDGSSSAMQGSHAMTQAWKIIGWNLECMLLAIRLFLPVCSAVARQNKACPRPLISLISRATIMLFTVSPGLVAIGMLDPYLGFSLYSTNVPHMEIDLYVIHSTQHTWLAPVGAEVQTAEGRIALLTSLAALEVLSVGHISYPSVWVSRRFADALCERVQAGQMAPVVDARFRITQTWAGRRLVLGLLGIAEAPPALIRKSCSDDTIIWEVEQAPLADERARTPTLAPPPPRSPTVLEWIEHTARMHAIRQASSIKQPAPPPQTPPPLPPPPTALASCWLSTERRHVVMRPAVNSSQAYAIHLLDRQTDALQKRMGVVGDERLPLIIHASVGDTFIAFPVSKAGPRGHMLLGERLGVSRSRHWKQHFLVGRDLVLNGVVRDATRYIREPCEDAVERCREWAEANECSHNVAHMHVQCPRSCGLCES